MWTPFSTAVFFKHLDKTSEQTGKLFWHWHSWNMTTYDLYLFCFQFTIKILLTLFLYLARSTCFLQVLHFFLFNIHGLKISIQKEKHMSFYSWHLVNITRRKMGNWKKFKRAILENKINVQKQPLEVLYKKGCS